MTDKVENFIHLNIDLIDSNEWDNIQYLAYKMLGSDFLGEFNQAMLDAGIDPLIGVQKVYVRAFAGCKGPIKLYPECKKIDMCGFMNTSIEDFTVPEGVEFIGGRGFSDCLYLKTIYLPKTLNHLGPCVFLNCPNLTKIVYNGSEAEFKAIDKADGDSPFAWFTFSTRLKSIECVVECTDANIRIGGHGQI